MKFESGEGVKEYISNFLIIIFFDGKREVLLKDNKVYITLVTVPGLQSLISPKAVRSLIYGTSTKLGQ